MEIKPIAPSPLWSRAMPPGPGTRVRLTEAYVRHVARDAYFWMWPLVNVHNRRLLFATIPEARKSGPLVQPPLNQVAMLTDYVSPEERIVACPNQDVVYGMGGFALDLTPMVVQVPDFGDRFWAYQITDLRTDGFTQLGKMYGTTPGFYLIVGPDWQGALPEGITRIFRSTTSTAMFAPRVFQDDSAEDRRAIQDVLTRIMIYPLAEFDGSMKSRDWSKLPEAPYEDSGDAEVQWVVPAKFLAELPAVLDGSWTPPAVKRVS